MKYHALMVIFEKGTQFEIVVCCKLQVALYGLTLSPPINFVWCLKSAEHIHVHSRLNLIMKANTTCMNPDQIAPFLGAL